MNLSTAADARMIDLTGNWQDTSGFQPFLQCREPWSPAAADCDFHQALTLPPGTYEIRLVYDVLMDKRPGLALRDRLDDFTGLRINGVGCTLRFERIVPDRAVYQAHHRFTVTEARPLTELGLCVHNSRPLQTQLRCWPATGWVAPVRSRYIAIAPEGEGETLIAHGLPFLSRRIEQTHMIPGFQEGIERTHAIDRGLRPWHGGLHLPCRGVRARRVHFLGMIHSIDVANGSWYSPKGDHGYSHFAGDQAGEIQLHWRDGRQFTVPLIFGFNLWYSTPWDLNWHYPDNPYNIESAAQNLDPILFGGRDTCRDVLQAGIGLVDGIRPMASWSCNARFIFSLELDEGMLESIEIRGTAALHGQPVISAVTLESADAPPAGGELAALPDFQAGPVQLNPVTLADIAMRTYAPKIEAIQHLLYTFADELPVLAEPIKPTGYFGPQYDFQGPPEARYAATFLYHNGPECAAHIADTGTGCQSSTARWSLHHYVMGTGIWVERPALYDGLGDFLRTYAERSPGHLPGIGQAWCRGIGELAREAMALGYGKFIDTYLDWLDRALFAEANPPHWNRIAGVTHPDLGHTKIQVGDIEEWGSRENDGHGICLWGRAMVWHWLGRPRAWNERRWPATRAAVEWIQWQLDTDHLHPGVRKDVLFTLSECAHNTYDFYSSYNCLHGIGLSIAMAEQLGQHDTAARWRRLYQRLARGILDHLTEPSESGPIWVTEKVTDWQDHAHKLAHLQLATEGHTYTPLEDFADGDEIHRAFLTIDRNTYRQLMRGRNYNCLRMYGYGQGMMTQSALLLDEMADAEQFLNLLVRHCYLPRFGGWICPEGIITHSSGRFYLPVNGYMGQDSHVADSTKALRLLLGVDDNDPSHLRLVPRFPADWIVAAIADYPVLTGDTRQRLAYRLERAAKSWRFTYEFERPVPRWSLRLGPLPVSGGSVTARHNTAEVPCTPIESGDSRWVWIRDLSGATGEVSLLFTT